MKIFNDKLTIVKCLVLLIFALCFAKTSNSQDVISKKDDSTIQCKVTKVSSTEVEYKNWSNLEGSTYVIGISDVSSIKYQNGDVDEFNQQSELIVSDTISGVMSRSGRYLLLNGVVLSDSEVLNLLGEQGFDKYVGARRQIITGTVFTIAFAVSLTGVVAGYIYAKYNKDNRHSIGLFAVSIAETVITIPFICVFYGVGNGRMRGLVKDFNKKHNTSVTFSVSPSLINCEMPQLQNNYGLGVTLRANF